MCEEVCSLTVQRRDQRDPSPTPSKSWLTPHIQHNNLAAEEVLGGVESRCEYKAQFRRALNTVISAGNARTFCVGEQMWPNTKNSGEM